MNLLAGTVSEYVGHIEPALWRRYVGLLLEGMRNRKEQKPLAVDPLRDEQLAAAMQGWHPAG